MSDQKFEKILKRIYTITLGREINQSLFLKLNEEQTNWVIQAAANVIIADGKIDSGEFEVMQDIIQYTKLSYATLMRYIMRGNLKVSKQTGRILARRSKVDEWLNG